MLIYFALSVLALGCVMMLPLLWENPPDWYLWAWDALKWMAIVAVIVTGVGVMI